MAKVVDFPDDGKKDDIEGGPIKRWVFHKFVSKYWKLILTYLRN